ncbi:MAG: glycosyl hydrolase 53 family protein [Ignavibacteriaceae bacterium]
MRYFIIILLFVTNYIFAQTSDFIKGADISFVPQIEDLGGAYTVEGTQTDPVEIFNQNGVDYIRLRLWHTPTDGYCGLTKTIQMATRIKQSGSKFLLDIHYSDTWADPAHQTKPAAWQSISYTQLVDSIYSYTYSVMQALNNANVLPDMIQIGNEITVGFLWPEGRVGGTYNTTTQWQQFTTLLKTARNAIVDAVPGITIPIMLHIDRGGDNAGSRWFFDKMNSYQVPYDYIGLSFYPWWHGTLTQLSQNLNDLATRYSKKIIVAETAYPWTLQPYDNNNNIVGNASQLHDGYPSTVDGQFNFLFDLIQIVKNVPNNKGKGIFYWAPEFISVQPIGSPWENLALFNFQGEVLTSISAFNDIDTSGAINVTFNLNSSTNWDTLKSSGIVQLRGEVVNGSNILPGGENLTWDQNSQVILQNAGGDYWTKTIRVLPGSEIQYKYWTGHSMSDPTFLRLGWEGPIQPYDLTSGNYRKFIAGYQDTIIDVEYFNSSGVTVNQYWKPFESKQDSIAIYYRVNLGGVTSTGRFNPNVNGPVGVRGSAVNSTNILSWDITNLVLTRESSSVNNGSFWSGVAYYPNSTISGNQEYKFFIENDSQNGWENNVANRNFIIPSHDTTISWVYFDNQPVVTDVDEESEPVSNFILNQNYPNPFNPTTNIQYEINNLQFVTLKVFDVLGNEVAILVNEEKTAGNYKINFTASELSSGIYFFRLTTELGIKSIKAILLK